MKHLILFFFFVLFVATSNAQEPQIIIEKISLATREDEQKPKPAKPANRAPAARQNTSIAKTALRQLTERGFTVCSDHPVRGDIYANADKTRFCYIDPKDGIIPASTEEYAACLLRIIPEPVATPAPAAAPAPMEVYSAPPKSGFRVIEVLVHATPQNITGDCPQKIVFTARISAVGGSGLVSYKWLRNDGASAPVETIQFEGPGSKSIETTWQLGGPDSSYKDFWQQIEVFDPVSFLSNKAFFTLTCK
jgi:hypothetical protein